MGQTFSRGGGSNFFSRWGGGVQLLIPYRNPPGGSGPPVPPSGSALVDAVAVSSYAAVLLSLVEPRHMVSNNLVF